MICAPCVALCSSCRKPSSSSSSFGAQLPPGCPPHRTAGTRPTGVQVPLGMWDASRSAQEELEGSGQSHLRQRSANCTSPGSPAQAQTRLRCPSLDPSLSWPGWLGVRAAWPGGCISLAAPSQGAVLLPGPADGILPAQGAQGSCDTAAACTRCRGAWGRRGGLGHALAQQVTTTGW